MSEWCRETDYGSPERTAVLVYGKIGPGTYIAIAKRFGHFWRTDDGTHFSTSSITHWMPLPPAPNGSDK